MDDVRGRMWASNALTTLRDLDIPVNAMGQYVFMPVIDAETVRKLEFAAYELNRSIECLKSHFDKKAA
jgi:hypothetical protein